MSDFLSAQDMGCPFCKSRDITVVAGGKLYFICCGSCGARGPVADSADAATAFWSKANYSRHLLRLVIDESPAIISLKDSAGRFLLVNDSLARLYHTSKEAMIGKTDSDFICDKEHIDVIECSLEKAITTGCTIKSEQIVTDADQSGERYFHILQKPLRLNSDAEPVLLIMAHDVTELRQAQQKVAIRERRYDEAMMVAGEGIWDWDLRNNRVAHNRIWCQIVGLADEVLEHPVEFFASLVYHEDRDDVIEGLNDCLNGLELYEHEHRLHHSDGSLIWVYDRGRVVEWDKEGKPVRMIGSVSDISARKDAELNLACAQQQLTETNIQLEGLVEKRTAELVAVNLELQALARSDALTGLANRMSADEYLTREFARIQRTKGSFALLLADIDFFKRINDNYGHAVGDQALKHVARLLQNNVRETDFVARFGGEEFLLVLSTDDPASAYQVADKLRERIVTSPFTDDITLTISIGVALVKVDQQSLSEALLQADEQLYIAKREGRNCVRVAS